MKNLYAFLLLLLGFASGTVSTALYLHSHPERTATYIPSRTETFDAMADEVGLDPTQRIHVHEIAGKSHGDLVKVHATVAADLKRIRETVRSQMRALMTPDQAVRFDTYCARRDKQREHEDE